MAVSPVAVPQSQSQVPVAVLVPVPVPRTQATEMSGQVKSSPVKSAEG